jgi:hypothetical protein
MACPPSRTRGRVCGRPAALGSRLSLARGSLDPVTAATPTPCECRPRGAGRRPVRAAERVRRSPTFAPANMPPAGPLTGDPATLLVDRLGTTVDMRQTPAPVDAIPTSPFAPPACTGRPQAPHNATPVSNARGPPGVCRDGSDSTAWPARHLLSSTRGAQRKLLNAIAQLAYDQSRTRRRDPKDSGSVPRLPRARGSGKRPSPAEPGVPPPLPVEGTRPGVIPLPGPVRRFGEPHSAAALANCHALGLKHVDGVDRIGLWSGTDRW